MLKAKKSVSKFSGFRWFLLFEATISRKVYPCWNEDIALWKLTANTPVCHTQSVRKHGIWNQVNADNFCHFKHKRKASEFEENVTDVRKENILLPLAHKMKYLITGLSFLVENPQVLLENTIPLAAQPPPPPPNKKVPGPPFLRMLQIF